MRPWVFYLLAVIALIIGVVSFVLPILIGSILVAGGLLLFGLRLADRRRQGSGDGPVDR